MKKRSGQLSLGDLLIGVIALAVFGAMFPVLSAVVSTASQHVSGLALVMTYTILPAIAVMLIIRFVVAGERRYESPQSNRAEQRLRRERQPRRRRG